MFFNRQINELIDIVSELTAAVKKFAIHLKHTSELVKTLEARVSELERR